MDALARRGKAGRKHFFRWWSWFLVETPTFLQCSAVSCVFCSFPLLISTTTFGRVNILDLPPLVHTTADMHTHTLEICTHTRAHTHTHSLTHAHTTARTADDGRASLRTLAPCRRRVGREVNSGLGGRRNVCARVCVILMTTTQPCLHHDADAFRRGQLSRSRCPSSSPYSPSATAPCHQHNALAHTHTHTHTHVDTSPS